MSNHHHHGHDHVRTGNIKIAFVLNLVFTLIEIVGGILTNSIAILSDALHDLGDSLSLGMAWYFQHISGKKSNQQYSYGYRRFSLLGAVFNSLILVVGSVYLLSQAIPRLSSPGDPNEKGMILLAILGVIVNGAAVWKLNKGNSLNEKVVSLHLLEDVLGWVAVLIGAIIMYFFNLPIIDPILSILISFFILFNVVKNLKETSKVFLQGTPDQKQYEQILSYLLSIGLVVDVHDLHIWSMDGEYSVLTAHLVLEKDQPIKSLSALKKEVRHNLHELGIEHATLEFEIPGEECVFMDC